MDPNPQQNYSFLSHAINGFGFPVAAATNHLLETQANLPPTYTTFDTSGLSQHISFPQVYPDPTTAQSIKDSWDQFEMAEKNLQLQRQLQGNLQILQNQNLQILQNLVQNPPKSIFELAGPQNQKSTCGTNQLPIQTGPNLSPILTTQPMNPPPKFDFNVNPPVNQTLTFPNFYGLGLSNNPSTQTNFVQPSNLPTPNASIQTIPQNNSSLNNKLESNTPSFVNSNTAFSSTPSSFTMHQNSGFHTVSTSMNKSSTGPTFNTSVTPNTTSQAMNYTANSDRGGALSSKGSSGNFSSGNSNGNCNGNGNGLCGINGGKSGWGGK